MDGFFHSLGVVAQASAPYAAAATLMVWAAIAVLLAGLVGLAAFALPRAGKALARKFPRVGIKLGIPQHNRSAALWGTPAE